MLLCVCRGGIFVLENPGGSWMFHHPRLRFLDASFQISHTEKNDHRIEFPGNWRLQPWPFEGLEECQEAVKGSYPDHHTYQRPWWQSQVPWNQAFEEH